MALHTAADIPLQITSPTTSSERRISPSWTISQFKARLEPITGIPATSQRLVYRGSSPNSATSESVIEASDESSVQLLSWNFLAYAEILVQDTRPPALQHASNLTDPSHSNVPKYEMPQSTYETLPSSVLAFKKANKLGRFAPGATPDAAQDGEHPDILATEMTLAREKGLAVGARCRLLPETDARRGKVAYVGPVEQQDIPAPTNGPGKVWVGLALDEPVGKNDGSIRGGGTRYFECASKCGVFVRPERVEIGDFGVLGLEEEDELDSDMEEI